MSDKPSAERTASGPWPGVRPAVTDVWSHIRLWPVAALGLAADLWTKHWAFTHLDPQAAGGRQLIPRLLGFRRTLNDGALFGLGKGLWLVFIIASILALGFVWYLFSQSTRDRRSLHVALGLILAGALGNLYDRAFVLADVVRTSRGTFAGTIVTADGADPIRMVTYPDGKPLAVIHKSDVISIKHQGVVRDFIKVEPKIGIELWPWVFNIADMLLVVGVGLLLLNFYWERRELRRQSLATAGEQSSAAAGP